MILHPYKLGSRSAKRLKDAMNGREGSRVATILQRAPKARRALIVNWGSAKIEYPEGQHWIINSPKDVNSMSDKVKFFERVDHNDDFLDWTTDVATAQAWTTERKVFVRHLTRGSGGRGIDVWTPERGEPLPVAPLYTGHQPKTHEYRLHMARSLNGCDFEPILVQRKVWTKKDEAPKSWDVRSHDNGFIFQSYPVDKLAGLPPEVFAVGRRVMAKHFPEMHFAALDVLYHQPTKRAVVCEGNTAPGLENDTVRIYSEYFLGLNEEFKKERRVVI